MCSVAIFLNHFFKFITNGFKHDCLNMYVEAFEFYRYIFGPIFTCDTICICVLYLSLDKQYIIQV